MKKVFKFFIPYAIIDLLVFYVLVARDNFASNVLLILLQWLPIAFVYYIILLFILKNAKRVDLQGVLELCGACVATFPLASGLWLSLIHISRFATKKWSNRGLGWTLFSSKTPV